jgi:predicted alpha/beta hydrolase family esterase
VATFLFLHGWQGSGPGHWQRLAADELARRGHAVRFPDFPDPDFPSFDAWLDLLEQELAAVGPHETAVLAHSLGCYLWLHHAVRATVRVARVLLVAPPAPDRCAEIPELRGLPYPALDPGAVGRAAAATELVYAEDDPYWPNGSAAAFGEALRIPAYRLAGGGHVNVASGYGDWPAVLAWCEQSGGF